jgi:hypothetical protein
MPESVRKQFALPSSEEVLLDNPVVVEGGVSAVRASELLLLAAGGSATELAAAPQAGRNRAAVVAFQHGEGQVIVSGLLDGYRYRGDEAFDPFWRALVADAAMAARPAIDLRLDPAVAHPGGRVTVRAELGAHAPNISAALATMSGETDVIRLWPGPRAGSFVADIPAPPEGGYIVRVTAGGASAEVPLLVAGDVVQPAHAAPRTLAYLAKETGGAVLNDVAAVRQALAAVEAGEQHTEIRPMRSPWWIMPFVGLLGVEWGIRRRAGLK